MVKTVFTAAMLALALLQPAPTEFVELDIIALDRQNQPSTDLTQNDFEVRDGGARVTIRSFQAVTARGMGVGDGRSVVLLMDDVGVSRVSTMPMQQLAGGLLSPSRLADEIAVIRLSRTHDEPFGDVETARERIEQYRGEAVPFSSRDTPEAVLQTVARTAASLEPVEHRRKALICLGGVAVCNPREPVSGSSDAFRTAWTAAVSAAGRANLSVYEVDPFGLTQSARVSGAGLVQLTGGDLFRNSNGFRVAAAHIWDEASQYYLVGYWGAPAGRNLIPIDVRAARRDVRLRVRQFR